MRTLCCLSLALTLGCAHSTPPAATPTPPPSADTAAARFIPADVRPALEIPVETYTLTNGLKVALSPDTTAPIVTPTTSTATWPTSTRPRSRTSTLPADWLRTYVQRVEAVTPADVTRIARKYLDPSRMTLVVVGDRKVIEDSLKQFGPVKVEAPR